MTKAIRPQVCLYFNQIHLEFDTLFNLVFDINGYTIRHDDNEAELNDGMSFSSNGVPTQLKYYL
jgi:hypothetical protein